MPRCYLVWVGGDARGRLGHPHRGWRLCGPRFPAALALRLGSLSKLGRKPQLLRRALFPPYCAIVTARENWCARVVYYRWCAAVPVSDLGWGCGNISQQSTGTVSLSARCFADGNCGRFLGSGVCLVWLVFFEQKTGRKVTGMLWRTQTKNNGRAHACLGNQCVRFNVWVLWGLVPPAKKKKRTNIFEAKAHRCVLGLVLVGASGLPTIWVQWEGSRGHFDGWVLRGYISGIFFRRAACSNWVVFVLGL